MPLIGCGSCVYNYNDPDPLKWFEIENISNFSQIDLFCVLGDSSNQYPIKFNGGTFNIKLGILTAKTNVNQILGGGEGNNRIVQRTGINQPGGLAPPSKTNKKRMRRTIV